MVFLVSRGFTVLSTMCGLYRGLHCNRPITSQDSADWRDLFGCWPLGSLEYGNCLCVLLSTVFFLVVSWLKPSYILSLTELWSSGAAPFWIRIERSRQLIMLQEAPVSNWQTMDDLCLEWFTSSMQKVNTVRTCLPLPARVDTDSTVSTERSETELSSSATAFTWFGHFCCTLRRSDCFYCILDTLDQIQDTLFFCSTFGCHNTCTFYLGLPCRILLWSLVFSLSASMFRVSLASTFAVGFSVWTG